MATDKGRSGGGGGGPRGGSRGGASASATVPRVVPGGGAMEKLWDLHNSLPLYYYVYPILATLWGVCYLLGVLKYLIVFYAVTLTFSPHASWETIGYLVRRCFRPFPNYPLTFNLTPLGILCSRIFLIFPFDTVLYYLDEIFFRGYKGVEVKNPFLILGQPRSGTTKFESVLEGDHDLLCLKMYEIRFPYLSFLFAVDAVCHLDATYLNGAIARFVEDYKLLHCFDETNSERAAMRRLRWNLSDEDDVMFLYHFLVHFQLLGAFPAAETVSYLHHFDHLSSLEKRRMLLFHKRALQKVLYRRGPEKRYFGKWVLSWCGVVQEALEVYPDLKILVMVRNPADQLRSWFKLQGLLAKDLTGHNAVEKSPEVLAELKRINVEFYRNEIEIVKNLHPSRRCIVKFSEFYKNIEQSTRDIYRFLGKEIREGSSFDTFLKSQTQQQLTHKATETNDAFITDAEVARDFPNLLQALFEPPIQEGRPKEE